MKEKGWFKMTESDGHQPYEITKGDLFKYYNKWMWLCAETSNNYERLQSLGICNAMSGCLKKLYGHDQTQYVEALERHLVFFNSEGSIGTIVHGISLSMEEEKAQGNDEITGEMITGIKTGLMGPVAGMGDTLVQGTIKPLILGLACNFAIQGNVFGVFLTVFEGIVVALAGYGMFRLGYRLGKESISKILNSQAVKTGINAISILGLFMMGVMSFSYVKVSIPLIIPSTTGDISIQTDILDQILPGILPLIAVFAIYLFFTRIGQKYTQMVFAIILLSLVCSFIGLLG